VDIGTDHIPSRRGRSTRLGRCRSPLVWIAVLASIAGAGIQDSRAQESRPSRSVIMVLSVQDAIGPATSEYIRSGISAAESRGAELLVLELDTPGGLDSSLRDINQAILAARVPVATYVYPQGARAASAGTYMLYASHIAAMAPATTTGAATPVSIGGTNPFSAQPNEPEQTAEPGDSDQAEEPPPAPEPGTASERKAVNDAVSYIRGLAERRGRNAEWAERAVRSADSISAQVALELGVVDFVAADLDDLMSQVDGTEVDVSGRNVVLSTSNVTYEDYEADWRTELLAVITNPEVAYMLLLIGIYGLIFEGYNPGAIVPGVVGAISLLLALFAFQVLPVNYAGLALIILGIVLMIAEFFVPSFGALGLGGIAAFVFGSLILIDTEIPGFERPTGLITAISAVAGAGLLGIVWFAMRARRRPVVSGIEEMQHLQAVALADFPNEGPVLVRGERWRAHTSRPVTKGQTLRIRQVAGLSLEVDPVDETPINEEAS
jgi:membrane-bound serine protease (ClpP class)